MRSYFFILLILQFSTYICIYDNSQIVTKILDQFINGKIKTLFKVWHLIFKKSYSLDSAEARLKFSNFKSNLQVIKQVNSMNLPYKLGLNQFSDLTNEEFTSQYTGAVLPEDPEENFLNEDEDYDLTKRFLQNNNITIDWSSLYSSARDQGSCGSCWAFGTAGAIEGNLGKKTNKPIPYLSTQQLLDCNPSNYSCKGGDDSSTFNYITSNGIMYDKDYIYKAVKGTCQFNKNASLARINGFKFCNNAKSTNKCTKEIFLGLLSQGPLSVALDASGADFQNYQSGVFTGACKASKVNHIVVLIGYGYDSKTNMKYWLIRNSWGSWWGEKGNIRIAENDKNKNSCFIAERGYLPLV